MRPSAPLITKSVCLILGQLATSPDRVGFAVVQRIGALRAGGLDGPTTVGTGLDGDLRIAGACHSRWYGSSLTITKGLSPDGESGQVAIKANCELALNDDAGDGLSAPRTTI